MAQTQEQQQAVSAADCDPPSHVICFNSEFATKPKNPTTLPVLNGARGQLWWAPAPGMS